MTCCVIVDCFGESQKAGEITEGLVQICDRTSALIQKGYDRFLIKTDSNFEIEFAKGLLWLKQGYTHIRLQAVVPCKDYNEAALMPYDNCDFVLEECDELFLMLGGSCCDKGREAWRFMVDNSEMVFVVCCSKSCGEAHKIISYAKKQEKRILTYSPYG